ncbi:hypothetical protein LCGC14_1514690 [marine sediment metagenome]|uniref:Uncharacterized protein n=1 Tax=marine sediment metagenome TaxID=412755 RepID=A0A0F9J0K6_9ZZZZ
MDGFAYIVQILDMGLRFFENQTDDSEDSPYDIEREFRELEKMYEEPMEDWRVV